MTQTKFVKKYKNRLNPLSVLLIWS